MPRSNKEIKHDPLLDFIKDEVPFRLKEVLNFPEEKITEKVVKACIKTLYDDSDVMFDYDAIDGALEDVCNEFGLYRDDEDKIITVCYGERREWENRDDAKNYFMLAMASSEGSELERYATILTKLEAGLDYCTDEVE